MVFIDSPAFIATVAILMNVELIVYCIFDNKFKKNNKKLDEEYERWKEEQFKKFNKKEGD